MSIFILLTTTLGTNLISSFANIRVISCTLQALRAVDAREQAAEQVPAEEPLHLPLHRVLLGVGPHLPGGARHVHGAVLDNEQCTVIALYINNMSCKSYHFIIH